MFTLVVSGPQGYKVVRYNAIRYLDLKEGNSPYSQLHGISVKNMSQSDLFFLFPGELIYLNDH